MKPAPASEAKQRPGHEEMVYLEIIRTADELSRPLAALLKADDLSLTQYNVLRILRGTREGLPCGEIGSRMITRDPDITRLLDRLEKRLLITRSRQGNDRRVVTAKITAHGLKLLRRLDQPLQELHRSQLGHLGRDRLRTLIEMLQTARAGNK